MLYREKKEKVENEKKRAGEGGGCAAQETGDGGKRWTAASFALTFSSLCLIYFQQNVILALNLEVIT